MGELLILILLIGLVFYIISKVRESPFRYPYFEYCFDVSGKRKPNIEDFIDAYINNNGIGAFETHYRKVQQWKDSSQQIVDRAIFKDLRQKQFLNALTMSICFVLRLFVNRHDINRLITKNFHIKNVQDKEYSCDYQSLIDRYIMLQKIDFQCTLNEYHCKNQRKLMTKALRKEIMLRDNYTCQICGKYMPDEVGLHIDHIIPVSKGGKTIVSNLQVLCSKCNGKNQIGVNFIDVRIGGFILRKQHMNAKIRY